MEGLGAVSAACGLGASACVLVRTKGRMRGKMVKKLELEAFGLNDG